MSPAGKDNAIHIKKQALIYLGKREYGSEELRKKLLEKFPEATKTIDEVIQFLRGKDWLSDERFLEAFIREQQLKRQGWHKISQKLREKGFEKSLIKAADKFFEKTSDQKNIEYLAQKKRAQIQKSPKKLNNATVKNKIKLFLVSRGFGFEAIEEVLEKLFPN